MNGPNRTPGRALLLLAALALPAGAQEVVPPLRILSEAFRDAAREHLLAPPPPARVGAEPAPDGRLARLLEDLDLDLRLFESAEDDDLAPGFGLDLAKTLRPSRGDAEPALDLRIEGLVAAEREQNPDDSLSSALRLRWSGARTLGPPERGRAAVAEALELPEVAALRALDPERFERLAARFDPAATGALASDPDFVALAERHVESLAPRLAPELAWSLELASALESNQDFSSRQVALGGAFAARLVGLDPDSALSRANLFDLPAAVLRWLTGTDERFGLTGQALPGVVAGLDVVDAARDEVRGALTDDESFLRARLELALASHAFTLDERPVELGLRWRFFQELDAPSEVRRAGGDDTSHLELRLAFPRGWFLAWTAGELPLDPSYDSTVTLGYALSF
ncbi:MAG TPA: hypothetical protein VF530_02645 [Planctomycetota bacterium]